MKKLFIILLLILSFVSITKVFSQTDNSEKFKWPLNVGIWANLNVNMHLPNFILNNVILDNGQQVTQQKFDVNSLNLSPFGLICNYPINETFTMSGRLGYNVLSGDMEEHTTSTTKFQTSIGYLEISPILQVHNLISSMKKLYFLADWSSVSLFQKHINL